MLEGDECFWHLDRALFLQFRDRSFQVNSRLTDRLICEYTAVVDCELYSRPVTWNFEIKFKPPVELTPTGL